MAKFRPGFSRGPTGFLPKDWRGSYYDPETGNYFSSRGNQISEEQFERNVARYVRNNPEHYKHGRTRSTPVPEVRQKFEPKRGRRKIEMGATDFWLHTVPPSQTGDYYAISARIPTPFTAQYLDEDGNPISPYINVRAGVYTIDEFESDEALRASIEQAIEEDYGQEVIGYFRSANPIRI